MTNKRPSFQFYPSDWLSDPNVMAMTPAERGVYIQLIATMWTTKECGLKNDPDYLARLSGGDREAIGAVSHCFYDKDGMIHHKRLDYERQKQDDYFKSCSDAGKRGNLKRWGKPIKSGGDRSSSSSSSSSPTPSSSSNKLTKVNSDKSETTQYGNKEINKMLEALKGRIGIDDFADSRIERNMAKHCVGLIKKISGAEFKRRLDSLLDDPFTAKNCNKIKFVYNNIKGFIEPKVDIDKYKI